MLIDTHAHLDVEDFDKDRDLVVKRAVDVGLVNILTVGVDIDSSQKALDIARQYDPVYAAVGCHPHNAKQCGDNDLKKMADMVSDDRIVAWGEIGLDFYRLRSDPEIQISLFRDQVQLAYDLNLPVIIHDREAHDEVFDVLKKMGKGKNRGVIHCFSGDVDFAESLIDIGFFISIPGTVTYKKALRIRRVARTIPLEYMLFETDSPFLTPVPNRGKRNEPSFVRFTAMETASLREMDFDELCRITTENATRLFGMGCKS